MVIEKIIVSTGGLLLIGFIYWFFFGKKEKAVEGNTQIIVEGGYKPSIIKIKKGVKTTLTFTRRDPNSCLEEVVIPAFKVKKYLPINTPVNIEIIGKETGEFGFRCGMGMFSGKIIID